MKPYLLLRLAALTGVFLLLFTEPLPARDYVVSHLDTPGIIAIILVILGFCLLTGFTIWLRGKTTAPAAPKKEIEEDPRQIEIRITCDDGHAADFLRELANHIEERDEDDFDFEYESFHGCAEITTED